MPARQQLVQSHPQLVQSYRQPTEHSTGKAIAKIQHFRLAWRRRCCRRSAAASRTCQPLRAKLYLAQCDVLKITCTGCAAILNPGRICAPAPLEPQDHPPLHLAPTQELGNLEQHKQYILKRWAAH